MITKGYSATTLPRFILSMRAAGRRCDLVLIDGDHGFVGTSNDLKVLRKASGPHTAVVVDDVVPQCGEGLGGAVFGRIVNPILNQGTLQNFTTYIDPCMNLWQVAAS